jgi:hypothetical protein
MQIQRIPYARYRCHQWWRAFLGPIFGEATKRQMSRGRARRLIAIRLGDEDTNPSTTGDPDWQPLINNPNYPDYTSGANNVTGAATLALALFVLARTI